MSPDTRPPDSGPRDATALGSTGTSAAETDVHAAHARTDGEVLLDVRSATEWAQGHAPGAVHLPLAELSHERLPEAQRLLCICRSGNRSGQATAVLRRAGIDAANVTGGMVAWEASGLPVVCDDGTAGAVA